MKRICAFLPVCIAIFLLITECNNGSNSVSKTTPEMDGTVGTDLFEQIYVPFAKGENRTGISDVKIFLEDNDYEFTCVDPTSESIGEITVTDSENEDYVYFAFLERDSGVQTIMTASYYQKLSNSEVALSNYSTNGDHAYDQLTIHNLGEENQNVNTVDEQREFFFRLD